MVRCFRAPFLIKFIHRSIKLINDTCCTNNCYSAMLLFYYLPFYYETIGFRLFIWYFGEFKDETSQNCRIGKCVTHLRSNSRVPSYRFISHINFRIWYMKLHTYKEWVNGCIWYTFWYVNTLTHTEPLLLPALLSLNCQKISF